MGRAVSLADLTGDVTTRYDAPLGDTDYFVDTAVTRMINESLQGLYAMLIELSGDDYYTSAITLTTTPNVGTVALPAQTYRVKRVFWLQGSGTQRAIPMETASVDDYRYIWDTLSNTWNWALPPKYRLWQNNLQFTPIPTDAYTVQVVAVLLPVDLVDGADTFDCGPYWQEWVVNDVCVKLAQREDQDPSRFLAMRADVEQRIRSQAPRRDESAALQVRDLRGVTRNNDPRLRPGRGRWWP